MNQYRGTEKDIHERIYTFVVTCYKEVILAIPKTTATTPIISQIASSLTSMGANDQEADGAISKKDFIAKLGIVRKETKETKYWLTFIGETDILPKNIIAPYAQECHEILLIISKILSNLEKKELP